MPNVMEMRNLRNKPSRNGFDLSTSRIFSARAGEIVPVFCKLVMPGDKVELYPKHFTRTQPLNTAAYCQISEQVNFFKVRLHQLHNMFDTFVTDMDKNIQTANGIVTSNNIPPQQPYITQYDLAKFVNYCGSNNIKDELGYPIGPKIVKLLQYLGYGDFSLFLSTVPSVGAPSRRLNIFPLLAYQKVYFDYFRYQQWESCSPWCFNINWASFGEHIDLADDHLLDNIADCMLTPRYANFKKDFFLGVLPRPQYGDSSVVPIKLPTSTSSDLSVLKTSYAPSNVWESIPADGKIGYVKGSDMNSFIDSSISNPSVLSIRKSEAIQKLREIQQSGDQDYKTQIEKIFGVSLPDVESDLSTWLGGYDSSIDISEVVNTNVSDSEANIKGKGVSSSNGKISFESKDFSIIIGVYTAIPKLYYDMKCPRPVNNIVDLEGYPNPVLDRIGMESVLFSDLLGYLNANTGYENKTFGYAPRYYPFKTSYDEVLGAFKKTANTPLQSWVAPFSDFIDRVGSVSTYLMFKVDPAILNPIFTAQVTKNETSLVDYWNTEQFLVNMSIGDASVRPLDYDGLPYS